MSPLRRIHFWLRSRLKRGFSLSDFVIAEGIRTEAGVPVEATTSNPKYYLDTVLRPGLYRIELNACVPRIDAHPRHGRAQFYLDDGSGESDAHSWMLPFRSGVVASGELSVHARSRLRFDPIDHAGAFRILSLSVRRMAAAPTPATVHLQTLAEDRENLIREVPYAYWIAERETARRPGTAKPGNAPHFLVVIWGDDLQPCLASIQSVLGQAHDTWTALIMATAGTTTRLQAAVGSHAKAHQLQWLPDADPANDLAQALQSAQQDMVWLLRAGDRLAPTAQSEAARQLQTHGSDIAVYTDQDFLDGFGQRCAPYFKPDWSPDTLCSFNYLGRAIALPRQVLLSSLQNADWRTPEGWHETLLRATQACRRVVHCAAVLYHQQLSLGASTGCDTTAAATAAVGSATVSTLLCQSIAQLHGVTASPGSKEGQIIWGDPDRPAATLATVIVPTRDGGALLRRCVHSLLTVTRSQAFELIVVDNGSVQSETLDQLADLQQGRHPTSQVRTRVLPFPGPFNFSAINNRAVEMANSDVVVFLNDDIEVTEPGWLDEMTRQAMRPGLGCIGARLLYPNHTVQHAGIVTGMGGIAGHLHRGHPSSHGGYFHRLDRPHNVSAVTGAALAVRKTLFESLGGFDEGALAVAYNDVDLCLKALAAGYRNLITPFATLVHHESASRGADTSGPNRPRLEQEAQAMRLNWPAHIHHDPYYNIHLNPDSEEPLLGAFPREP